MQPRALHAARPCAWALKYSPRATPRRGRTDSPECTPATPELVARWQALFQPCLKYAVDLGFDIAFTPHLDDGLNNGQWRNAMRINPLEKYGGMSYFDVVLKPLADSMAATLQPDTYVRARRLAARRRRGRGARSWAAGCSLSTRHCQHPSRSQSSLATPTPAGVVCAAG